MAADLAGTASSGMTAQLCGDAHLSNFGASPRRRTGGWCSTSTTSTRPSPVRSSGTSSGSRPARRSPVATEACPLKERKRVITAGVASYRTSMATFADMTMLDVWYARLDVEEALQRIAPQVGER